MSHQLADATAIVGIGQTEFSKAAGRSETQLASEAIVAALDDAGLAPEQVDSAAALVRSAGGKVLSSNPSIYIVELAGTELEIGEFIIRLGAFGEIIEVVRSGVLGIARGNPRMHLVK